MHERANHDRRRRSRRSMLRDLMLFHRGVPIAARLLNLSEGGALLETPEHLSVAAQIVVVIYLPDRTPLALTARVRFRREGIGAGIEFTHLTPHQRRRIAILINSSEPREVRVS